MSRDVLRGIEVFCQQRRGHHQGAARVHEPFPRRAVSGKFLRGFKGIHPGEIPHRVVELHVIQPPQHYRPWIASPGPGGLIQHRFDPCQQFFPFCGIRLGLLLRRHFAQMHLLDDPLPGFWLRDDLRY